MPDHLFRSFLAAAHRDGVTHLKVHELLDERTSMCPNPNDTLDAALALLGYNDDAPALHRSNLLHAIHAHAVSTRNEGLAFASEARINLIKDEVTSAEIDTRPATDTDRECNQ